MAALIPPIVLNSPALRCVIDPNLGAGIADFSVLGPQKTWYPIMRRSAPGETNASLLGSFFMVPWANRISGARFEFAGAIRTFAPTTPTGTPMDQVVAQHGDVRKRPWRVTAASPTYAELLFESTDHASVNWPWAFRCQAKFSIVPPSSATDLGALTVELIVTNTDTTPFPVGCGHHPYFMRRLWADEDELRLRVPVTGRYPLTNGCATGPVSVDELTRVLAAGGPVPSSHIDACFAGTPGAPAELHWPSSGVTLSITPSEELAHWVVYAPREGRSDGSSAGLAFIAVEPQSHANDAINLGRAKGVDSGVRVLQPGQSLRTSCAFAVRRST